MKRKSPGRIESPRADEALETPPDEPQPIPVQEPPPTPSDAPADDPPTEPGPGSYIVSRERASDHKTRGPAKTRAQYGRVGGANRPAAETQKLLNMEENIRKARGDE